MLISPTATLRACIARSPSTVNFSPTGVAGGSNINFEMVSAAQSVTLGGTLNGGAGMDEVLYNFTSLANARVNANVSANTFAGMDKINLAFKGLPGTAISLAGAVNAGADNDEALLLTLHHIIADGWYDFHAKYAPGGSRHEIPAKLPAEITEACLDYALRAHRALGCRGVSRTDFRWDESRGLGGLYLLETNTQPGMTPTSLAPEQAASYPRRFSNFSAASNSNSPQHTHA